ncbi:ATP-binding cassette domain-containing protein [Vibrio ponticus]|uniref:ATP-binding cassette domain-containing protein n=1 Tax=Vibrio ponticus TaxID=265668 RepID=A0A3N3DXD7_9VIBR|nr:ATP-binding cassette domain-containing protein [Vibrio ponticus]ROV59177.1 ATP-binding cassette domain-containing protein [Vibrio ponticus]
MNISTNEWKTLTPFNSKVVTYHLLIGLVLNILVLVIPIYSLQVFDRILTSRSIDTLIALSSIALFLLFIQVILDILKSRYAFKKSVQIDAIFSSYLYKSLPISSGNNLPSQNDVREIKSFVVSQSFSSAFDIVWTPIFILVMFALHPVIGALCLGAIILVGGFSLYSFKSKQKQHQQLQASLIACRKANDESQTQQESYRAQHLISGLTLQYQHITAERIWHEQQLGLNSATLTSYAKFIRFTLQMAIMAVSALLVVNNEMSAGGIIAASILMSRALQPYEQLTSTLQGWRTAYDADCRLQRHFAAQTPNHDLGTEFDQIDGRLHIDNLTWYTPNSTVPLLKNLRLKLESGNHLLIMGATGTGKTALCKLIAGIYAPTSGSIKIDGASITQWMPEQLQHTIGYLPQKIEFATGSIKQNIAHFDPHMTDQQVISAARKIGIHEAIINLADGYNTIISANTNHIAMGLHHGIGLARAIYYQPKVLILDEPTAHLDTEKVHCFKRLLEHLKQQQVSVIIASHQKELINHVDWVVELNNGQITSAQKAEKITRVQNVQKVVANA